MPIRSNSDMNHLEQVAEGRDLEPWRFINGQVPSTGAQTKGTNPRTERIQRLNAAIRERELEREREQAASAPALSDRESALELLAELPELLDQAQELRQAWDVPTEVLNAKQQVILDIKAQQLALSHEPDLVKRAEKFVSLPTALQWAQAEIPDCQQEVSNARRALEACLAGVHMRCFNAAKYLRQDYIAKLVAKVRTVTAKVLGEVYGPDLERLVLSSERVEKYTDVVIPIHDDISIDDWRSCFNALKKLAEA